MNSHEHCSHSFGALYGVGKPVVKKTMILHRLAGGWRGLWASVADEKPKE